MHGAGLPHRGCEGVCHHQQDDLPNQAQGRMLANINNNDNNNNNVDNHREELKDPYSVNECLPDVRLRC